MEKYEMCLQSKFSRKSNSFEKKTKKGLGYGQNAFLHIERESVWQRIECKDDLNFVYLKNLKF